MCLNSRPQTHDDLGHIGANSAPNHPNGGNCRTNRVGNAPPISGHWTDRMVFVVYYNEICAFHATDLTVYKVGPLKLQH